MAKSDNLHADDPILRCPACGHRLSDAPLGKCPLCEFDFKDERVTGADVTPYARAYAHGAKGFGGARVMYEWVWFAGTGRLKHIALMRSSAASRRFARWHVALLSVAAGIFAATWVGWKQMPAPKDLAAARAIQPTGQGWVHVTEAPRPLPLDLPGGTKVDLWWNLPQAVVGVALAMATGAVLAWLATLLLRAGLTRAHIKPYHNEQRMTAALHYSMAGVVPLFLAAVLAACLPLYEIGRMAEWRWYPPRDGLVWAATAVAGVGLAGWWFWLVRIGATAPPRTRSRVVACLAVGAPIIAAGAAAVWLAAVDRAQTPTANALRLWFQEPPEADVSRNDHDKKDMG